MIDAGRGGAIVITASAAGVKGYPSIGDYCASKHGVLGLMKVLSQELGEHSIRVNAVNPTNVNTIIFNNNDRFFHKAKPGSFSSNMRMIFCRMPAK